MEVIFCKSGKLRQKLHRYCAAKRGVQFALQFRTQAESCGDSDQVRLHRRVSCSLEQFQAPVSLATMRHEVNHQINLEIEWRADLECAE